MLHEGNDLFQGYPANHRLGGRGRALVSPREDPDFVATLVSGGDSRLAVDIRTGLNRYHCPTLPAPDLICASSCTATPIHARSFARAGAAFAAIFGGASPSRAQRLAAHARGVEARLVAHFGVINLADAILRPSGTDALLTAAMLVAAERPGKSFTAIIPSASETGTGVPLAASCRHFDGPTSGKSLADFAGNTVEVPLRREDGTALSDDDVNDAYAAAAAIVRDRPVVYLTHSTKTGLIAPVAPPPGADVIVDACQGRIDPLQVAAYLRCGWLVVVTGSKFFGGPAFSGAVLYPRGRIAGRRRRHGVTRSEWPNREATKLAMVLRWIAALDVIEAFEPMAANMAAFLKDLAKAVDVEFSANPSLVPIAGLQPRGPGWADQPSIFTFGVRDPSDHHRLLSAAELRPLYEHLAREGVLLGQPVGLGSFGGLRIAASARDVLEGYRDSGLIRLFDALENATARPTWHPKQ